MVHTLSYQEKKRNRTLLLRKQTTQEIRELSSLERRVRYNEFRA